MVGKLNRLPVETQMALKQFACMGNSAEFDMLAMAYEKPIDERHRHLWEAVRTGLIFRSDESYRFLHDRVQEAAYSLIPEEMRAESRAPMDCEAEDRKEPEILFTHLMEAIGLALDLKGGRMFIVDFGGSVYSANHDGSKRRTLLFAEGNLTGIAFAEVPSGN